VTASVRRLPPRGGIRADAYKPDLFTPPGDHVDHTVGGLLYEDVGAAILEYPEFLATVDVTAWEPADWVEDWTMEYYGTNGTLRLCPNPPSLALRLRAARGGYPAGRSGYEAAAPAGSISLVPDECYTGELAAFLTAVRAGETDQLSLRAAEQTVAVLDAWYASAGLGRSVTVGAGR
jgi:predicted dehydrogenase